MIFDPVREDSSNLMDNIHESGSDNRYKLDRHMICLMLFSGIFE